MQTLHTNELPQLLREISDPPKKLFVHGTLFHNGPHIAIVGTRKAGSVGKSIAHSLALELGRRGCVIVSGLAFGIDAAAHKGALEAKAPTIAVVVGGVSTAHPRTHQRLADDIVASGGALVSEQEDGEAIQRYQFLERNRIISGLSLGVIVVEAPERSGSLATARFALEEGRDVCAVPGLATSKNYAGSHKLIQDGACLVTSADDVVHAFDLIEKLDSKKDNAVGSQTTGDERLVLEYIEAAHAPVSIDDIQKGTQLEARLVARIVSRLSIQSIIQESTGRYYI